MNPIVRMLQKTTSDYLPDSARTVGSSSDARRGLIVPELIFRYGDRKSHFRKFPKILPWLVPAVIGRFRGYRSLKRNPADPKTIADESLIADLKEYAAGIGCSDLGFVEVPAQLIFRGKDILDTHAVVLSMPMDKKRMARAPHIRAGQEVWRIYDHLGRASNRVAAFLRRRGYAAQAGAALGGDTNYPVLARMAGMGWIGKHGLLISPGLGPSQRLAVVYTSIENLPEPPENPFSWISDFCDSCSRCVRECPSGAIFNEKPLEADGDPRHIDYLKCIGPFTQSMGCSICIAECVFFRGDFDRIRTGYETKSRAEQSR